MLRKQASQAYCISVLECMPRGSARDRSERALMRHDIAAVELDENTTAPRAPIRALDDEGRSEKHLQGRFENPFHNSDKENQRGSEARR